MNGGMELRDIVEVEVKVPMNNNNCLVFNILNKYCVLILCLSMVIVHFMDSKILSLLLC